MDGAEVPETILVGKKGNYEATIRATSTATADGTKQSHELVAANPINFKLTVA